MNQLENSPLLTSWKDPVSGVESFLLSPRVAPIQQSFYYTHTGFSDDGRYVWFYCAFPPGGDAYYGRQLGVADFHEGSVRHFPETLFMDASPFVDGPTGDVYWVTGLEVWKRGPRPGDRPALVNVFPADLAKNRRPLRIATHLSLSCDRQSFAIDALIGNDCYLGDLPLDGAQPFRLWQHERRCYNHAQFSPVDPDLILLAQDGWTDVATGEPGVTEDRMWLLRRGGKLEPVCPAQPLSSSLRGHEWWDARGEHIWFIDYHHGTARVDLPTRTRELIWPNGHTHSHADRSGQYLVGDINPQPPHTWRVAFYNIGTGREVSIVDLLPELSFPRRAYHVHPHPRFCLDDRYICYTTNVRGTVDVALVPVAKLVEMTS